MCCAVMRILSFVRLLAAATATLALTAPARSQTQVDLQLVLAVDASGSVSMARFDLQKQGYAAAFRHPRVQRAILSGATGSIAVTMFQWTGPAMQELVIPWTLIRDEASAEDFAGRIERTSRHLYSGGTSISGAIDFGMRLMPPSPYQGIKRVIDVSGDGSNNRGRDVSEARDDAVRAGVTVNGLPILAIEPYLDRYFFNHVIGGPGAFMIPAESYEAFADAVVKKLILEIAANPTEMQFEPESPARSDGMGLSQMARYSSRRRFEQVKSCNDGSAFVKQH